MPSYYKPEMEEVFKVCGRQITLGECEFVFDRVFKVTCENNQLYEKTHDIKVTELFHYINLCGILMNKAEPDDDDETPFEQFQKYAHKSHDKQD